MPTSQSNKKRLSRKRKAEADRKKLEAAKAARLRNEVKVELQRRKRKEAQRAIYNKNGHCDNHASNDYFPDHLKDKFRTLDDIIRYRSPYSHFEGDIYEALEFACSKTV